MKRIVLVLALAGSALFGSVVTATAIGGPTTETEWRARLTDCVIVAEADTLGVPRSRIPATAARCRLLRVVIGSWRFR